MTLLDVTDLTVSLSSSRRPVQLVRPVSFRLEPGETVGLLGEPGSGSSDIAKAIAGMSTGDVGGTVVFDGRDLLAMSERELLKVREVDIALVTPAAVGDKPIARGRRTRALPPQPKLLVVEVDRSGVDDEIRRLILRLQSEAKTAVVLVTEDRGALADLTDLVIEMYVGKAVEFADGRTLNYRAHHPYTLALLSALPVPGSSPSLDAIPSGCPFHPRCPYVMDRCIVEEPPPRAVAASGHHRSACWLPLDLLGVGPEVSRRREEAAQAGRSGSSAPAPAPAPAPAVEDPGPTKSVPLPDAVPAPADAAPRARLAGRPAPPARPQSRPAGDAAPIKKTAAKKAPAKKAAVKKAPVTQLPAKKAAAKKAPAKKAAGSPAVLPVPDQTNRAE
jgi:oligopeptide/dipeptide ABC transporter ATP-binding protein